MQCKAANGQLVLTGEERAEQPLREEAPQRAALAKGRRKAPYSLRMCRVPSLGSQKAFAILPMARLDLALKGATFFSLF